MSRSTIGLPADLLDYVRAVSLREPPVLRELRELTATLPEASMQISPEQGQFMGLLIRLTGARRVIEIGTFTGYSALSMALALPPDGQVLACEIDGQWSDIARRHWHRAGVGDRIELRLGPALQTLASLRAGGADGSVDFVFIDADKTHYTAYYEEALALLRPGGLIAIDNVLWGGDVINPDNQREATRAIRAFNDHLSRDGRIDLSLVPIGDGLSLALKRPTG